MLTNEQKSMDKIVDLCKSRGFVYPGSEIYGGLANSWDYGPLGVELKNNIKRAWWKKFVQESPYNVGLDASIIMNPETWVASGHLGGFSDPLMDCKSCKTRHRADNLIEDFDGTNPAGWSIGLGLGAAVLLCLHQPLGHWLAVLPLPQCRFHQLTGFLCPACGNTRAVLALLQGHPLRSIGYNPMIFTLFAALTCLYAELVCTAVGKPRRILPRSNALLFLTVGIVLGYDIVRNFFPAITLCK